MSCASWTRVDAEGAPAARGGRGPAAVAARIGSLIAGGWRAYWDWRVKRTTVLMLRSLDRRTLHDIGIDPSEIESLVHDPGRERRRRHDADRPWRGGGG
jgi:uncharacterized protein YjiS (DUF1127 family)